MKILYTRFNKNFNKIDLCYTNFYCLKGFYDYALYKSWNRDKSLSLDSKRIAEDELKSLLALEDNMMLNNVFTIKSASELKNCHSTISKNIFNYFNNNDDYKLNEHDKDILQNFDKFTETAKIRSESHVLAELYQHGGLHIDNSKTPNELFLNNIFAGYFLPKVENWSDYHMNENGDELSMSTDEVLLPLKAPGAKYGDELFFYGNDSIAINFPDCELFHCDPATAVVDLINNKNYSITRYHVSPEQIKKIPANPNELF